MPGPFLLPKPRCSSAASSIGPWKHRAVIISYPAITRDRSDDYLLAYALVGQADYLVTGDRGLLVRGKYPDKPEMIAAHSSPVMVALQGSAFGAAADAVTILEQIEGVIAYLDTVGTRAETRTYQRMRLVLESAHRRVHNRLHALGYYHAHTPTEDHKEHH